MEWNQLFSSYFQSYPKTVPPLTVPLIVGEGDVTSITFPDGSVQFYFIPTIKQNQLSNPYSVKNQYSQLCPLNAEVWFVRSIAHPQANINFSIPPGYFNSQIQSTFGECPPYSPPDCCMNAYPPTYREYTQKFHNDTWTSTTDIHYFYPSLRHAKRLQYCTETQTEISLPNKIGENGECNKPCHCESNLGHRPVGCKCHTKVLALKSSEDCMSVDNEISESGKQKNKKYKRKSVNNTKTSKRVHICECVEAIRDTSDKLVTTYADQATGNTEKGGRETQTKKLKSKKQKSKSQSTKPILIWNSSSNTSCISDRCTCSTCESDQ